MAERLSGLLDNPVMQAGVLPFVAALLLALALARTRWLALASGSGMVIVLALGVGFSFVPLSSVRKMTLVVLLAIAAGLALAAARVGPQRSTTVSVSAALALASVWALQRIIEQAQGWPAWWMASGAVLFVLVMSGATLAASADPLRALVIGTAVGWGSGALAVLGASALLGQFGIALGTSCAAAALATLLRGGGTPSTGWTAVLPAAAGAPLVAVLAVATGELHAYVLLPLLLVVPAACLVRLRESRPWVRLTCQGIAALMPVIAAVAWAWFDANRMAAGN